jgi:hypothetical protein
MSRPRRPSIDLDRLPLNLIARADRTLACRRMVDAYTEARGDATVAAVLAGVRPRTWYWLVGRLGCRDELAAVRQRLAAPPPDPADVPGDGAQAAGKTPPSVQGLQTTATGTP